MPKIFVSYRREDSPAMAGWVHDKLHGRYGKSVFRDIDSIDPTANFKTAIGRALRDCDVVVAVIGPKWRGADVGGQTRIHEATDWIRLEIEMALHLGIPIIPVLVDRAPMPKSEEIPDSLRDLISINGLTIDPGRDFDTQFARLTMAIERLSPTPLHQTVKAKLGPVLGNVPPGVWAAVGAAAWLIGWLVTRWYEAKEASGIDDVLEPLGVVLEWIGALVFLAGIALLVLPHMGRFFPTKKV